MLNATIINFIKSDLARKFNRQELDESLTPIPTYERDVWVIALDAAIGAAKMAGHWCTREESVLDRARCLNLLYHNWPLSIEIEAHPDDDGVRDTITIVINDGNGHKVGDIIG